MCQMLIITISRKKQFNHLLVNLSCEPDQITTKQYLQYMTYKFESVSTAHYGVSPPLFWVTCFNFFASEQHMADGTQLF